MRLRALLIGATVVAVAVLSASPASALTKVRFPATLSDHVVMTGFCSFPITVTDTGQPPTVVETFDAQGNLLRIDILPHGLIETTISANGLSVTVNNTGPVTLVFNADGTVSITQRGQSITGDTGDVTSTPLLRHTTGRVVGQAVVDPVTGGLLFTSLTFSGSTADVCALLTP